MPKTTVVALATLLLVVLAPGEGQAQICIDWVHTCDGLELTIEGNWITGYIRNADCEGLDVAVVGVIRDGIENPCGPEVGRVGVACDERFGCELFGDEWYFVYNEAEDTWDLGHVGEGDIPPPQVPAGSRISSTPSSWVRARSCRTGPTAPSDPCSRASGGAVRP